MDSLRVIAALLFIALVLLDVIQRRHDLKQVREGLTRLDVLDAAIKTEIDVLGNEVAALQETVRNLDLCDDCFVNNAELLLGVIPEDPQPDVS